MGDIATAVNQYGLVGIIVLMLIKEFIFMFRKKVTDDSDSIKELVRIMTKHIEAQEHFSKQLAQNLSKIEDKVEKIEKKTDTLYDWHNVTDTEGAKIWYVGSRLEKTMDGLRDAINRLIETQKENRNAG